MESKEAGTRYESVHTGREGCPECQRLEKEGPSTPEDREVQILAEALMRQWDGMITVFGKRLVERVRAAGHERLQTLVKKLGADE